MKKEVFFLEEELRSFLKEMSEEEYRRFSSNLLPGVENILGVRVPTLRKLAKEILKKDWKYMIEDYEIIYFEERMIQGLVTAMIKVDKKEKFEYISKFIKNIDSWSICDSFCSTLKVSGEYKDEMWEFLKQYFESRKEYEVRFAFVMALMYFIEEKYLDEIFKYADSIQNSAYYAQMAVAWAISICYVSFRKETLNYLQNSKLDEFTYNKSIQKMIESNRVAKEEREMLKKYKK